MIQSCPYYSCTPIAHLAELTLKLLLTLKLNVKTIFLYFSIFLAKYLEVE